MAGTVTSGLTNITLAEAADAANWDDIGGGPGSGNAADLPIQGTEARGRRIDNGVKGFSYDNTTTLDISGTGVHVGYWVNILQPALINTDGIELIQGDNASAKAGNWDGHFYPITEYPKAGGWIRIWVDPTRTRDTGSGTLALTGVRQFGCEFDMQNVGGTTSNCWLDRIDYTADGLLVDSGTVPSPATFGDLSAADLNTSNAYGVIRTKDGVEFVSARCTIGDATATIFDDSGFQIVFTEQPLCAADFMGITIDLQSASTTVDMADASIKSGGTTNQGDLIVTGTAGSFDALRMTFDSLRLVTLTSACTLDACVINACGSVALSGATVTDCTISATSASAAVTGATFEAVTDCRFISDGSSHAVEISSIGDGSYTWNNTATGYDAGVEASPVTPTSTGNETIYVNVSSGTLTISVADGATIPSIRSAGATVNVITIQRDFSFTVAPSITGYEWRLYEDSGIPGQLGTVELAGEEIASADNQSYLYSYASDEDVVLQIIDDDFEESITYFTLGDADQAVVITLTEEENT